MIVRLAERPLETKYGKFSEILYYDGIAESIALVMGDVSGKKDILCRIHSSCVSSHVFNSVECACREEMAASQAMIESLGEGVIVYLDQEGKGNGHLALMVSGPHKEAGLSQGDAYEKVGFERDSRNFRPAAKILEDLGVASVVLLTGNPGKAEELVAFGIRVSAMKEPMDEE
ncbi:MAG: GTP cyclohydrolase [Acidobacteria bacterium]|nr:MAG: GTP cyclohydrolase [Acidobacteriota bacterium]REK02461.1 MAG: GTP cyclohydrolase [Acidobacteriota bacterium]REK13737.1 MAG: GTP cyclohydrolase [Acidobacteriota bacterium]REK41731.1 MAG: GTP cyclohydrolase [Acidobacteriota bacterium]